MRWIMVEWYTGIALVSGIPITDYYSEIRLSRWKGNLNGAKSYTDDF